MHALYSLSEEALSQQNATTAICQQPATTVHHVDHLHLSGQGTGMALEVGWDDGLNSKFPGP